MEHWCNDIERGNGVWSIGVIILRGEMECGALV